MIATRSAVLVAAMLIATACAAPSDQEGVPVSSENVGHGFGGGPCPIPLPATPTAATLTREFARAESCRRSRALRIDKLHAGGQMPRATAAAEIIALRAETRRDIRTARRLSARFEPSERRSLETLLDKAETRARALDLS